MNKVQLETIAMRNLLLEENLDTINDVYSSNAKLYHDLNNHFDALYQLLDLNLIDDAKIYIEKISEPMKNLNKVSWTGIDGIDVILNSKLAKAQKYDVELIYNAEYPSNSRIDPSDMSTILSNLIDNAIEAVSKGDHEKKIKVTIRKINKFLTIQVVNAIFEPIKIKSGNIMTTKSDGALHGWGMKSVKAAAEKYDGTVKYSYDNQLFVVTVLLFF